MHRKLLVVLLVLSIAVVGASIGVSAADYTLRLGYADNATWPDSANVPEPEHAMALIFKQVVESKSNGQIEVQLFPSSQLGSCKEMVEMTKTGTLDIVIETGVMGSYFPKFQMINIPWVFQSPEVAWELFDNSEYWDKLMKEMEEKTNLTYLGMGQNGVRNFTNNTRPIKEPKDMKGLKFRVMESPIYVKTLEALGAKAVPIAWNEVYTSLQTGVVDGQENPLAIIAFVGKLHEVQKYLTLDGHVWSEDMMVMNADKFNNMPEDLQHILKIAGLHAGRADRVSEALMTRIMAYDVLKENMEIYKPTPAQIKKFQEKAQPAVLEWLKGEIGSKPVDNFLNAVEKAEARLDY